MPAKSASSAELVAHLRATAGRPFIWGETCCTAWVLEFADRVNGTALADAWRGTYRGPREMVRHHRTNAGFEANSLAVLSVLTPIDGPADEAIGLIRVGKRPSLGIVHGEGLLVRTHTSFMSWPFADCAQLGFWALA